MRNPSSSRFHSTFENLKAHTKESKPLGQSRGFERSTLRIYLRKKGSSSPFSRTTGIRGVSCDATAALISKVVDVLASDALDSRTTTASLDLMARNTSEGQ